MGFFGRKAEPLDPSEVDEWPASELQVLDGATYLRDDLYRCEGCEKFFRERSDLDDELLCPPCAEEAEADAEVEAADRRWCRWACR